MVGRKFEGLRAWFEGGPSHSDDFDSEYPVKILIPIIFDKQYLRDVSNFSDAYPLQFEV